ncbi:MAG: FeoA domain-containing protein [Desulfurococcales archaeon]|jgi:ferrous iron transport protein A|uniref:Ferrous iron transport protein A n=1 Tax=Fervidicoccus fontis TaxID=683846 RepID=A0A7J3SL35_9CREN
MKKLTEIKPGESVRVVNIDGGKVLRDKLIRLGIIPGTEIKVIRNSIGPVIVEVRQVQVAIGRGMADKITVEEMLQENLSK